MYLFSKTLEIKCVQAWQMYYYPGFFFPLAEEKPADATQKDQTWVSTQDPSSFETAVLTISNCSYYCNYCIALYFVIIQQHYEL